MFEMELKAMSRALDGLSTRFTAQSNNVANINTPNYQRQVVNFEDSLKGILETAKTEAGTDPFQNPMEGFFGQSSADADALLQMWSPTVSTVENKSFRRDGNGTSIESEMADVVKTVQRFNTVTTVLASEYRTLKFVIDQK
ncbi:flagellar basal body rod protein FlgB [compost metagenome]